MVWVEIMSHDCEVKKLCNHVRYGVATISRLLKITGLFCKKALQKRRYFAKETYTMILTVIWVEIISHDCEVRKLRLRHKLNPTRRQRM